MKEELKCCPFCGGEARALTDPTGNQYDNLVACTNCCAGTATDYDSQEEAIRAWNTRPTISVERVEEIIKDCLQTDCMDSLQSPELEGFDIITKELKSLVFGSKEYKTVLLEQKDIIQYHYKNNSHHPEHYKNKINDMSLLDLLEIIIDWKAAGLRHNGNLFKSIDICADKYNFSPQLKQIFINTAKIINSWNVYEHADES